MTRNGSRAATSKLTLVAAAALVLFAACSAGSAQVRPDDARPFCDGIDADAVMRSVPANTRAVKYRLLGPTDAYCFDKGGICMRTRTALMDELVPRPAFYHDACLLSFIYSNEIGEEGVGHVEARRRPNGAVWVNTIAVVH